MFNPITCDRTSLRQLLICRRKNKNIRESIVVKNFVFEKMSLLPKNHQEFKEKEYWDSFFRKRGKRAFEWYGEYGELCGILHKYIKPTDQILHIGCGNSNISADLFDVGYKNQYNIGKNDYFDYLIKQFGIHTCGESQVNGTFCSLS